MILLSTYSDNDKQAVALTFLLRLERSKTLFTSMPFKSSDIQGTLCQHPNQHLLMLNNVINYPLKLHYCIRYLDVIIDQARLYTRDQIHQASCCRVLHVGLKLKTLWWVLKIKMCCCSQMQRKRVVGITATWLETSWLSTWTSGFHLLWVIKHACPIHNFEWEDLAWFYLNLIFKIKFLFQTTDSAKGEANAIATLFLHSTFSYTFHQNSSTCFY